MSWKDYLWKEDTNHMTPEEERQAKDALIKIIREQNGGKMTRFETWNSNAGWKATFILIGIVLFFILLSFLSKVITHWYWSH